MHYQCAICIINVLYALSMCSNYAISMCRLVCTINVLYAISMGYMHYQCAICIIDVRHVMHYQCAVTMHYQCASGSSLNAVVVFNLEVTHAARFAYETTTSFNEEPKKGNLAWKAERKHSRQK